MKLYCPKSAKHESLKSQQAAALARIAPRKGSAEELLEVETIVHRTLYLAKRMNRQSA